MKHRAATSRHGWGPCYVLQVWFSYE